MSKENVQSNKIERNSNIELLRIIAMIMIIIHHIAIYTNTYILQDLSLTSYVGIYMFAVGKLGIYIYYVHL